MHSSERAGARAVMRLWLGPGGAARIGSGSASGKTCEAGLPRRHAPSRRPGLPPTATNSCVGDRLSLQLQQICSRISSSGCVTDRPVVPDRTFFERLPAAFRLGGFPISSSAICTSFVQPRSVPGAAIGGVMSCALGNFKIVITAKRRASPPSWSDRRQADISNKDGGSLPPKAEARHLQTDALARSAW
jgi:hypothetical protein